MQFTKKQKKIEAKQLLRCGSLNSFRFLWHVARALSVSLSRRLLFKKCSHTPNALPLSLSLSLLATTFLPPSRELVVIDVFKWFFYFRLELFCFLLLLFSLQDFLVRLLLLLLPLFFFPGIFFVCWKLKFLQLLLLLLLLRMALLLLWATIKWWVFPTAGSFYDSFSLCSRFYGLMKILLFARLVFLRWEFLLDEFTVFHIAVLSRQLFSSVTATVALVVLVAADAGLCWRPHGAHYHYHHYPHHHLNTSSVYIIAIFPFHPTASLTHTGSQKSAVCVS